MCIYIYIGGGGGGYRVPLIIKLNLIKIRRNKFQEIIKNISNTYVDAINEIQCIQFQKFKISELFNEKI